MPNFVKGEEITSVGAAITELEATRLPIPVPMDCFIELDSANAGTVQFAAGQKGVAPAFTNARAYPASAKLVMSVENGNINLWYKASGAGQKFTVTY